MGRPHASALYTCSDHSVVHHLHSVVFVRQKYVRDHLCYNPGKLGGEENLGWLVSEYGATARI